MYWARRWEDGLVQRDLPKKYMRDIVSEDDSSAGKGTLLTDEVVTHLKWIGKTVGPVIDQVRKAVHLTNLRKVRTPEFWWSVGGSKLNDENKGERMCHMKVPGIYDWRIKS